MHPLLYQTAQKAASFTKRDEVLNAINVLEDIYDSLDEVEMEAADKLLNGLNKRLSATEV